MENSLELELATRTEGSLEHSPRTPSLSSAIKRRWLLLVVLGAIFAGVGVAVGLAAHPKYTVDTELLVGSPNATVDAVPGFAAATQSLAESYSRAAESAQVIVPVAKKLDLPADTVAADLAVTPIPDSNVMTVIATGSSRARARTLASAASTEVISFVKRSQAQGGLATSLRAYRSAARRLVLAESRVRNLRAARPKPPEVVYTDAETALSVAQARADALDSEYSSALQDDHAAAGISVLAGTSGATSNRSSTVQKTGAVGALVGLVLGALIAFLIEGRRARWPIET